MRSSSTPINPAASSAPRRRRAPAPEPIIQRLPLYLSSLRELLAAGRTYASSDELGALVGVCGALVRSDLAHFGAFGVRGLGYEVSSLAAALERVLGGNRQWDVVLVGAGDLGCALVLSEWFQDSAFRLTAIFDCNSDHVGRTVGNFVVGPLSDAPCWVREYKVKVAILAVRSACAQKAADLLAAAGVRVILNYTPRILSLPPHVRTAQLNPVALLQEMVCQLNDDTDASSG